MAQAIIEPKGIDLYAINGAGLMPRFAGLVLAFTASEDLPLYSACSIDAANAGQVELMAAASSALFAGICIGTRLNGEDDHSRAPVAGQIAIINVPPGRVQIRVDAAVAAGVALGASATPGVLEAASVSGEPTFGVTLAAAAAAGPVECLMMVNQFP